MASRPVPSVLPYTLLKGEDGSPLLVFLLWRDRRSTSVESSAYWSSVVCPLIKEDNSPLDAVTRAFSEKTKGAFAPQTLLLDEHQLEVVQRKSPPKQKVEESRIALRKKIIQGNGVTILSIRQYITYVAPVRFVDAATLAASFAFDKGDAEWITAQDLFSALYSTTPDNAVTVRGHSYRTATSKSAAPVSLPLALPFTVTMRTQEAKAELAVILKQFNVDVDASLAPPVEDDAAAAAMPDVASLSLGAAASASPAAPAPAAIAASSSSSRPAAASRAPEKNYSCRKCRKLLFTDVDLSEHTLPANGGGKFAHKHIKLHEGGRRLNDVCSSYFIENIDALGEFPPGEGPLVCSKCQTRFGNYIWSGAQCSCGEWIVPAFQAVKSKVDERPTAGPSRVAHVSFQFQRPPPREAPAAAAAPAPPAQAASASAPPAAANLQP